MDGETKNKIGIIGFGNMGSIIGERLNSYSHGKYQVFAFDNDTNKTDKVIGVHAAKDNLDLLKHVETVILAIKPQEFHAVLNEIKTAVDNKLVISIAAGVTSAYIEKYLGKKRIIRAMPNMPARIGKGISCLSKGKDALEEDMPFVQELFTYLGETLILPENMMNAATAVSGSGPGYFYALVLAKEIDAKNMSVVESFAWESFIPELTASAKSLGFNEEQSKLLAVATAEGSVALLKSTGLTPSELITQIASPGGTTQAALEVLEKGESLEVAIKAAAKRAEELCLKADYVDWINYDSGFK